MLKIIESQKDFGTMNTGTISCSNLTDEDKKIICERQNISLIDLKDYDLTHFKKEIFSRHRENLGKEMGFDGNNMFMADQTKKDGSFFEINREYVEANPQGWTDIPEDILVVTNETPKVVIGHPVADCPVVMMTDRKNKISAIGHCGAEMIDRKLPTMMQEALRRYYGSRAEDLYTYISACAGEGWTYDSFPKWAKDEGVWNGCIYMGEDGLFHINMKPAILSQLIISGLDREKIMFSGDDTITDPNYYSNSQSRKKDNPDMDKHGRHFAGLFYDNGEDSDIEIHKGRGK